MSDQPTNQTGQPDLDIHANNPLPPETLALVTWYLEKFRENVDDIVTFRNDTEARETYLGLLAEVVVAVSGPAPSTALQNVVWMQTALHEGLIDATSLLSNLPDGANQDMILAAQNEMAKAGAQILASCQLVVLLADHTHEAMHRNKAQTVANLVAGGWFPTGGSGKVA